MKSSKIKIQKTATYCTIGNKNSSTKSIWFVCHGYGQLARFFIRNFNGLNKNENYIIAPEGLHRFYLNGFSGRVGASWMTKEEREDDINDYNNYLKEVYDKELNEIDFDAVKINLFGFSQGCATISRFLFLKNVNADNLILWSGNLPPDINMDKVKDFSNEKAIHFVIGNKDEFTSNTDFETAVKKYEERGVSFSKIIFDGKHEITRKALAKLENKLDDQK